MRCPKCGYISFDHLEKCRKCNKDIEAISDGLFGSTYNIQAPTFLHLPREIKEEPSVQRDLSGEQSFDEMDEYVDEDLEILIEEEESDLEEEISLAEDEQTGLQLSEEDDQEDDGEIEIDFSQFEDADEPEVGLFDEDETEEEEQPGQLSQHSMTIEIPDELSDISDLAPPGISIEENERPSGKPAVSDFADLDLDDLDFELGLDGLDGDQENSPGMSEEAVLALDEIDFTEALAGGSPDTSKKPGGMDMDLDLDFDLDLGGLSIHKDV